MQQRIPRLAHAQLVAMEFEMISLFLRLYIVEPIPWQVSILATCHGIDLNTYTCRSSSAVRILMATKKAREQHRLAACVLRR